MSLSIVLSLGSAPFTSRIHDDRESSARATSSGIDTPYRKARSLIEQIDGWGRARFGTITE